MVNALATLPLLGPGQLGPHSGGAGASSAGPVRDLIASWARWPGAGALLCINNGEAPLRWAWEPARARVARAEGDSCPVALCEVPMPSARHQAGAYALHRQPEVVAGLLRATGVSLPEHDLMHVDSPKLPQSVNDLEADAVVTLMRAGVPVLSVVLEIQLNWREPKVWVWPAYLASLRERRRCDVYLVVICLSTRTAAKCAAPIKLGHPGFVLTPIVVGPREIPRVTDVGQAREMPAMVVLSALAHPRDKMVLGVLPEALSPLSPNVFTGYYRLIEAGLPAASRRFLEVLMRTPYKSEFANKHHAEGYDEGQAEGRLEGRLEGRAEGLARAVLALLDERKIRLSAAARSRIETCRDESQLLAWLRRAAHVTTADELFA